MHGVCHHFQVNVDILDTATRMSGTNSDSFSQQGSRGLSCTHCLNAMKDGHERFTDSLLVSCGINMGTNHQRFSQPAGQACIACTICWDFPTGNAKLHRIFRFCLRPLNVAGSYGCLVTCASAECIAEGFA